MCARVQGTQRHLRARVKGAEDVGRRQGQSGQHPPSQEHVSFWSPMRGLCSSPNPGRGEPHMQVGPKAALGVGGGKSCHQKQTECLGVG